MVSIPRRQACQVPRDPGSPTAAAPDLLPRRPHPLHAGRRAVRGELAGSLRGEPQPRGGPARGAGQPEH